MNVISKDELIRGLLDVKRLEALSIGPATDFVADSVAYPMMRGQKDPDLKGLILVYKEWGKIPLETLNELQQKYPILQRLPLSYAGRLDPLAEGLMLVMVGDTNKDREIYLHLDKTYEVEVLLGVATDTGDIFGIPKKTPIENLTYTYEGAMKKISNAVFESSIKTFVGRQKFPYPAFSSKTVQGKPLFQWANEGKLNEIEIPRTDVEIYEIKNLNNNTLQTVSYLEILNKVEKSLDIVKGNFRFKEIRDGWKVFFENNKGPFLVFKIECSCSSGTYMRVLAEEIGKKLSLPALAYSIKRTKVGGISIDESL